ncbi:MAG: phage/plasmid primase, P4 family, partial [Nitrososphaerota archaeon]
TNTGKTTLINVITMLLGRDNVSSVSMQEMASDDRFQIANLFGKMANIRDDMSADIVRSVGKLKELTGGYKINAQFKFREPFSFENHAYLIFTCNELPPVLFDDDAFFNRICIRKFVKRFGGHNKPDRNLLEKLTNPDELSGILNWAVEGYRRLKNNGWQFSNVATIEEIKEQYKFRSNPVWAFATHCLEEDEDGFVVKEELYQAYKEFAEKNALQIVSKENFFKRLPREVNVLSERRNVGGVRKNVFTGISLNREKIDTVMTKLDKFESNENKSTSPEAAQKPATKADDRATAETISLLDPEPSQTSEGAQRPDKEKLVQSSVSETESKREGDKIA